MAGDLRHEVEQRVVTAGRAIAFLARYLDAHRARQALDRLDEVHVVVLHQEVDRVAVLAAAEAVIETLGRAHRERRGLLVVKRAAGLELLARLPELHPATHDFDDVRAVDEVDDELLRDESSHSESNETGEFPAFGHGLSGHWAIDDCRSGAAVGGRSRRPAAAYGKHSRHYTFRRAFTLLPTTPMSARPPAFVLIAPMTLPMSRTFSAPVAAMTSSIRSSSSSSVNGLGR